MWKIDTEKQHPVLQHMLYRLHIAKLEQDQGRIEVGDIMRKCPTCKKPKPKYMLCQQCIGITNELILNQSLLEMCNLQRTLRSMNTNMGRESRLCVECGRWVKSLGLPFCAECISKHIVPNWKKIKIGLKLVNL